MLARLILTVAILIHPRPLVSTNVVTIYATQVPLEMPADFDIAEPVTIEIVGSGGNGAVQIGGGGGGGGGGGYARWENVQIVAVEDCGVVFEAMPDRGDDINFADEDGLGRIVWGGSHGNGGTGGGGGHEQSSDHAPTSVASGGDGGSTTEYGGGGGGGAAGEVSAGYAGSNAISPNTGGPGGASGGIESGEGGNGGNNNAPGIDGLGYGGGGGGAGWKRTAGAGITGFVRITYTVRVDAVVRRGTLTGRMDAMRGHFGN